MSDYNSEIAVSLDIDWAPDEVVEYSLALLEEYGVRATLFMTHSTDIDTRRHELAIHPNFTSLDLDKHIDERLAEYPDSVGVRSHSFFFTERLRPVYRKHGFQYQSNVMMYRQDNIRPYFMAPGMLEIPLFWMDNFYIEMEEGNADFKLDSLGVESPGLKLFNFHPVHIFLNTCSLEEYDRAKQYYHEPARLQECRNTECRGTRDMFEQVLGYLRDSGQKSRTMMEISQQFRKKS